MLKNHLISFWVIENKSTLSSYFRISSALASKGVHSIIAYKDK